MFGLRRTLKLLKGFGNLIPVMRAEGRIRMTQDEFNAFCGTLAHTIYVVQWGGAHVWKVGEQEAKSADGTTGKHKAKNKLFAIGGWQDKNQALGITFKCGEIAFEMLRDAPGCRPAPYLASRGMKWIQRTGDESMSDADLKDYLRESHRLASLNLTKKLQRELGLNQGGDGA